MSPQSFFTKTERNWLYAAVALGAAALAAGLKFAPHRTLAGFLLGNTYFLFLAALALVFIAIQYLTSAGWAVLFRRVPEAMTAYLPAGAAGMLLIFFGSHSLYHWAHAEAAVHDAVLHAKAGYLNLPFWSVRTAAALLAWWGFARLLVNNSRSQDGDGAVERTARAKGLSAAFMAVFALTFTLASVDWLMSLEPHWYSTMYPWYTFSGAFLHAIAAVTFLTLFLRRRGFFPEFNDSHRHDLGKLLFAFSAFWAYLWFSQFLLIWYANIPEETAYYELRSSRGWLLLQALNIVLNFLAPAALLLSAAAKKKESTLLAACLSLLLGHALDLYIMVMPSESASAWPHWMDLPILLGLGALFLLLFERAFAAAAPVPEKDPYLCESLHHHA